MIFVVLIKERLLVEERNDCKFGEASFLKRDFKMRGLY